MDKYQIQIYAQFYTKSHVFVQGRLLKDRGLRLDANQGIFSSLISTGLRLLSREIPYTKITLKSQYYEIDSQTDDEGYFHFLFERTETVDILDDVQLSSEIKTKTYVQACNMRAYVHKMPHGIISDIDDTLLVTHVNSRFRLRMLYNTIFVNPFKRSPVKNASRFYSMMVNKTELPGPAIYVSNSPWNLYDYIQAFMNYNKFPPGIIQLRDFGFFLLWKKRIPSTAKYNAITRMLSIFTDTNFTCIGDLAEQDYNIYTSLREKYPNQIGQIILIRAGNLKNEKRIRQHIVNNKIDNIRLVNHYSELLATD